MNRCPQKLFRIILSCFLAFSNIPNLAAEPLPQLSTAANSIVQPAMLNGVIANADNPWQLDFVIDSSDSANVSQDEIMKLIKYFLAGLALPEEDLWVNLSPAEPDRIMSKSLEQTAMGQDMLALDYTLKQLTASLLSPDNETGKKFWEKIYSRTYEQSQNTDIPVETFNKIWIVPASATVYEHDGKALVIENKLKVMLESDYLASGAEQLNANDQMPDAKQIIRDLILPVIEDDVNNGESFANLRQIYNALLLATWYKTRLKQSLLAVSYADQKKIQGIETDAPQAKEQLYQQYLDIFRKGAADLIKEEYNPNTNTVETRHYFTGGLAVDYQSSNAMLVHADSAQLPDIDIQSPIVAKITLLLERNQAMLTVADVIKDDPQVKLQDLAIKLEFDSVKDPGFIAALKEYSKSQPQSATVFASGLIFPEDLLDFLLDSEPVQEHNFSAHQLQERLQSRQKARRRFVLYLQYLTEYGERLGLARFNEYLETHSHTSQEDIDQSFREYLGISTDHSLDKESKTTDIMQRFKNLLNPKSDQTFEWDNFEKYINLSYVITNTDPSFRTQILQKGIIRYCQEQNIKQVDIISSQEDPLDEWVPELLNADDAPQRTIGLIKSFKRNYLDVIDMENGSGQSYASLLRKYHDMNLQETKNDILTTTLRKDQDDFGFTKETIQNEFDAFYAELLRKLGPNANEQKIKIELIKHYAARIRAIKDFQAFERQLSTLRHGNPASRQHIAGIAFTGTEYSTDFWILAPLYRRANEKQLKIISFSGNDWQTNTTPSEMIALMNNIIYLADIGFQTLGNGSIIGADFENKTLFPNLTDEERTSLIAKKNELLEKLKKKGIAVLLMPTPLQIRLKNNPQFSLKLFRKNFKKNLIPIMLSSGNPSILQKTEIDEIITYALAFPNKPFAEILEIRENNDARRFYKDEHAFLATFKRDLKLIYAAEEILLPAVPSEGSARFKPDHRYYQAAKKFAFLLAEAGIINESGGGPGIMQAVQEGHDDARKKNRLLGLFQAIRIILNIFEPKNTSIERMYELKHFALRKYLLLRLMQIANVGFPGGYGTVDEVFESLRKEQPLFLYNNEYWKDIMESFYGLCQEWGINEISKMPPIFDSVEDMAKAVIAHWEKVKNDPIKRVSREEIEMRYKEGEDAVRKFKNSYAITIFGNPNEDNELGEAVLKELLLYMDQALEQGVVFRIASPEIFDKVYDLVQRKNRDATAKGSQINYFKQIQLIRYEDHLLHGQPSKKGLTAKEKIFQRNYSDNTVVIQKGALGESVLQIFSTFDSSGAIFLPGDSYVLSELYSFVTTRQTKTTLDRPVAALGYKKFFGPFSETVYNKLLSEGTIYADDKKFVKPAEIAADLARIFRHNNAMLFKKPDSASPFGGIDLKHNNLFKIEGQPSTSWDKTTPVQPVELNGLTPVIVGFHNAPNLRETFGIAK